MKLGNFKNFTLFFVFLLITNFPIFAADKIETIPLINLEELSPTFEEGKDELEKIEKTNVNLENTGFSNAAKNHGNPATKKQSAIRPKLNMFIFWSFKINNC